MHYFSPCNPPAPFCCPIIYHQPVVVLAYTKQIARTFAFVVIAACAFELECAIGVPCGMHEVVIMHVNLMHYFAGTIGSGAVLR